MNAAKVNMDEATEYLPNGQRVGDIGTPARTELFPSWQGERPAIRVQAITSAAMQSMNTVEFERQRSSPLQGAQAAISSSRDDEASTGALSEDEEPLGARESTRRQNLERDALQTSTFRDEPGSGAGASRYTGEMTQLGALQDGSGSFLESVVSAVLSVQGP